MRTDYDLIRVLVLEDEPHVRSVIVNILKKIGFYTIYEAGDGIEGMRELLRVKPDLILCDIHMEPVDGFKFLETLRNLSARDIANLPVIFLTVDTEFHSVLKAMDLHVNGYIAKPVSLHQLRVKIDSVLTEHEQAEIS